MRRRTALMDRGFLRDSLAPRAYRRQPLGIPVDVIHPLWIPMLPLSPARAAPWPPRRSEGCRRRRTHRHLRAAEDLGWLLGLSTPLPLLRRRPSPNTVPSGALSRHAADRAAADVEMEQGPYLGKKRAVLRHPPGRKGKQRPAAALWNRPRLRVIRGPRADALRPAAAEKRAHRFPSETPSRLALDRLSNHLKLAPAAG